MSFYRTPLGGGALTEVIEYQSATVHVPKEALAFIPSRLSVSRRGNKSVSWRSPLTCSDASP